MKINYVIVFFVVCGFFELIQGKKPDCPNIISKADWGGKAAKGIDHTIIPVKYVIIHHTVTPSCDTIDRCSELITNMQYFHMNELDFHDIGYNFLVGGDGNVYEGAGWHRVGAHTYGYNSKSMGIGFVGTFKDVLPNEEQLAAAKHLLRCAVDKGELDPRYKLLGARTVRPTESPGLKLFQEIKKWKGFTLNP